MTEFNHTTPSWMDIENLRSEIALLHLKIEHLEEMLDDHSHS